MTFPVNGASSAGSLYANLATSLALQRPQERPDFPSLLTAVQELTSATNLSPGRFSELRRCARLIFGEDTATAGDRQELLDALKTHLARERVASALTPSENLIDAYRDLPSDRRPPLRELVDKVERLIALTGLRSGDWLTWDSSFRPIYSKMLLNPEIARTWANFWTKLDQGLPSGDWGTLEQIDDPLKWARWERYREDVGRLALVDPEVRLRQTLDLSPSNGARVRDLQVLLNFLLVEQLMGREICEIKDQLHEAYNGKQDPCQPEEIAHFVRKTLFDVLRFQPNEQTVNDDREFGLLLRVFTRVHEAQRKLTPAKAGGRLRGNPTSYDFGIARLDELLRDLKQLEQSQSALPLSSTLQFLFTKIPPYTAISKCRLGLRKLLVRYDALVRDLGGIRASEGREMHLMGVPILKALVAFFIGWSSSQLSLSFTTRISQLFETLRESQCALYRAGWNQLQAIIGSSDTPQRNRQLLANTKVIFDLSACSPHLSRALGGNLLQHLTPPSVADRALTATPLPRTDSTVKVRTPRASTRPKPLKHSVAPRTQSPAVAKAPAAPSFPYRYHWRVARWANVKPPLSSNAFPEYYQRTSEQQHKMIRLHSFSGLADRYWNRGMKIASTRAGAFRGGHQFILPAELQIGDKRERGVIVWAVGRDEICYHRFFHVKPIGEVFDKTIHQTFSDADFPELITAQSIHARHPNGRTSATLPVDPHSEVEYDELLRIVTLRELEGMKLKLYLIDDCHAPAR